MNIIEKDKFEAFIYFKKLGMSQKVGTHTSYSTHHFKTV